MLSSHGADFVVNKFTAEFYIKQLVNVIWNSVRSSICKVLERLSAYGNRVQLHVNMQTVKLGDSFSIVQKSRASYFYLEYSQLLDKFTWYTLWLY